MASTNPVELIVEEKKDDGVDRQKVSYTPLLSQKNQIFISKTKNHTIIDFSLKFL